MAFFAVAFLLTHPVPILAPVLKLDIVRVHLDDHVANLAADGGEEENPDEKVDGDEPKLDIGDGLRSLADSGEGESGPVEAGQKNSVFEKLLLEEKVLNNVAIVYDEVYLFPPCPDLNMYWVTRDGLPW